MKKIFIFTHNDLDGLGVQILAEMYASNKGIQSESYRCSYHDINDKILNATKDRNEIEEVIIGDISVSPEVARMLHRMYKDGIPVRLRDHHETAEWLNKYPWAVVSEKDNDGVPRCGTWMLSMSEGFKEVREEMMTFITEVDSWDTWKWKSDGNELAKNLNSLLQIMGNREFCSYITSLYDVAKQNNSKIDSPDKLFTERTHIMLETYQKHINKIARSCENSMWMTSTSVLSLGEYEEVIEYRYKTGVVFCNDNISEIADIILSNHPEIDILMLASLPRKISFRTQKDLEVPLGVIAKAVTGSGGGHPQAASSVIDSRQFPKVFNKMLRILQEDVIFDVVKFSNFHRPN